MALSLTPRAETSIPLRKEQQRRSHVGSSDEEEQEAFLIHPRAVAGHDNYDDGGSDRASTDGLVHMNDSSRHDDVENWPLDDLSVSDFSKDSDDDDDDEMTAALKNWKERRQIPNARTGTTLLKALYRRNRLCLLMTAVLLLVFLPLIVFGSRIRDWAWYHHSEEWVSPDITP
jgi:hypothetical protein